MTRNPTRYVSRLRRKLDQEGWAGMAAALQWRWQQMLRERSPVGWAQFGAASRLLGRAWPPAGPAVVVLSLPRSGSSWVGQTLGLAPEAAYLREPLDQLFLARGGRDALHVFKPGHPP